MLLLKSTRFKFFMYSIKRSFSGLLMMYLESLYNVIALSNPWTIYFTWFRSIASRRTILCLLLLLLILLGNIVMLLFIILQLLIFRNYLPRLAQMLPFTGSLN
ncbi:hypothetical protein ACP275_11G084500 [Erythranthe tilingii]